MSTFASPATAEATVAGAATAGTAAMIVEGAVLGLAQAMVLARAQPRLARVRPRSRPYRLARAESPVSGAMASPSDA
ncbi:hypothetical protein IU434_25285 [Nocardia farcinica]|uniref:hypothetical protein n=1 Tax=Nocardia farcinica TaxID=37329 RepID=UPI001893D38B|nr:hypothetical protein [Nocardia farcinica]MBF6445328.1 hypothetical protein [Nocardia farcinica]